MLTLTEKQWQTLRQGESARFVCAVCDEFLSDTSEPQNLPGRATILARMQTAYDYAVWAGFTQMPHITRLMKLAAHAPRIHDDPVVDRYLRKPGATPEQRLDDLDAVVQKKLKGSL